MSPEQVRGGALDPRTDIWSLGVVLFELLSGYQPFSGPTNAAILASIAADPPLRLEAPGVPASLVRVVEQCLRKSPRERAFTALQLSAQLSLALVGRPLVVQTTEAETGQVLFRDIPVEPRRNIAQRWAGVGLAAVAVVAASAVVLDAPGKRETPPPGGGIASQSFALSSADPARLDSSEEHWVGPRPQGTDALAWERGIPSAPPQAQLPSPLPSVPHRRQQARLLAVAPLASTPPVASAAGSNPARLFTEPDF